MIFKPCVSSWTCEYFTAGVFGFALREDAVVYTLKTVKSIVPLPRVETWFPSSAYTLVSFLNSSGSLYITLLLNFIFPSIWVSF